MFPTGELSHFRIEPLSARHDRPAFSCGVPQLDAYLHRQAGQDVKKRAAAVFVASPDSRTIAGYYTLSQFAVVLDAIPRAVAHKLPKYPMVPATLLGRLAVSQAFRGKRLGEFLLMDALHRSLTLSAEIASVGIVVDAIDDSAAAFYRKYGFFDLLASDRRLFLPMGTIQQLFH